jgi:exodeoxyribonuclease VII small subunit
MSEASKTADFETMLSSLEKIVSQLEGELKLEEALSLFEQGLELSQECEKFLKTAENKIEVLRRTASGIKTETVDESEFLAAQT